MHASLEQLIGLRDEEPVAAEVQQHVRACSRCAEVLNGLLAARERLAALPDPPLPPQSWSRVATVLEQRARRRRWLPAAGTGLAAALAGAVLLFGTPAWHKAPVTDSTSAVVSGAAPADVSQLMAQSRYLERAVLNLNNNAEGMPVSADTASTVAALEDQIALVDYQLNDATAQGGGSRVADLWKRRVDLLQSLAAVRYAQVADNGI